MYYKLLNELKSVQQQSDNYEIDFNQYSGYTRILLDAIRRAAIVDKISPSQVENDINVIKGGRVYRKKNYNKSKLKCSCKK